MTRWTGPDLVIGPRAAEAARNGSIAARAVGYAEAQVRPLLAMKTSDHALRIAVGALASGYARVVGWNGASAAATGAVAAASKRVGAICPGGAA